MSKPTQPSKLIVAKCDDGAFRKILLVDERPEGINAMTKYGQTLVYGWYRLSDNDDQLFDRVG